VPAPSQPHVSSTALALAALGLASVAALAVLTASGATTDKLGRFALHAAVVAAPVATGLFAARHRGSERFGRMLILAALFWSLAVLSESSDSVLYSTGRVAAWFIFPILVYMMLAFPYGRLTTARDRLLFRWVVAVIAVLYVGSALVVEHYPTPTPWASCSTDCPPNAFMLLDSEPEFAGVLLGPVRDGLAALLLAGVTVSLAARMRGPSAIWKVTSAPLVAVSIVVTAVLTAFIVLRRIAPDADAVEVMGLAWALCLPGIAAAFSVGLLNRRLFTGDVLSGLSLALRASLSPRELGAALRSSIGDPAVDVLVRDRDRGRWLRDDGEPVDPSAITASGRRVRQIVDDDGPVAAIVIDRDVDADRELIESIVALSEAALRETSLRAELDVSQSDLDESRKRIATAADAERRRIERDLHDGAQQRLIALRMRLSLAEELLQEDPQSASLAIRDLGDDVDHTLQEIRSLAHGIYPALLVDRGLGDALQSAGRRCTLPVDVRASGVTRHPPEIESAVYFSALEALQNVVKHARGATRVGISLSQNHVLAFEVADDGAGFDTRAMAGGVGLRNMRDRIEPLGGTLSVLSSQRGGVIVRGVVPLSGAPPGDERPGAEAAPVDDDLSARPATAGGNPRASRRGHAGR
jgi:signal transduction histidine kinase